MNKKILISVLVFPSALAAAPLPDGDQLCVDLKESNTRAISQAQTAVEEDPFFEDLSQQREADRECMLDLSKELGGAVSADSYGLGAIIDDVFKQISESMCNVTNNNARNHEGYGGATPSYVPAAASQQAMPAPVPTPPPVVGPSSNSNSNDVWSRLSEAMSGRSSQQSQ
ncbi:hypothetical protein [Neopusillimonas maritima]|jgi:hypothetical protein|uniref:Uncharacterized protein n=1 Tax=Neopusillimonas maritima TaxID=2026239 RepID=A0ABX9MZC9_9BURK|nr:hypothetical protein [Neopusillimonas maritima]RII83846.1 hypothetical protein CJO09_00975 [Neopusillimonas maritima]